MEQVLQRDVRVQVCHIGTLPDHAIRLRPDCSGVVASGILECGVPAKRRSCASGLPAHRTGESAVAHTSGIEHVQQGSQTL